MKDSKDFTILIVDDDESMRDALISVVKSAGYNVVSAINGREAFEIATTQKVDLVLSDVRMPGGNGIELLDRLKAHSSKIPIVMFITGFSDLEPEDAYSRGADAVFAKPFKKNDLLRAMQKALESKDVRWGENLSGGENSNIKIQLNFPGLNFTGLNFTHDQQILKMGHGGMFVSLDRDFPAVGTCCQFSVLFGNAGTPHLEGSGILRWVRKIAGPDLPAGCGIEFEYLSDACRSKVVELLNSLDVIPFIPK